MALKHKARFILHSPFVTGRRRIPSLFVWARRHNKACEWGPGAKVGHTKLGNCRWHWSADCISCGEGI